MQKAIYMLKCSICLLIIGKRNKFWNNFWHISIPKSAARSCSNVSFSLQSLSVLYRADQCTGKSHLSPGTTWLLWCFSTLFWPSVSYCFSKFPLSIVIKHFLHADFALGNEQCCVNLILVNQLDCVNLQGHVVWTRIYISSPPPPIFPIFLSFFLLGTSLLVAFYSDICPTAHY